MNLPIVYPMNGAQFAAQTTTYTGTAGTLTGWGAGPKVVAVLVTTLAYVRVGKGAATSADLLCAPNITYYMAVPPQPFDGTAEVLWTVSAIQLSSGGSVYAKPCAG